MRALVLCGGIPQIELIKQLKKRRIYTILADVNENVPGKQYADKFFNVSVLDKEEIKNLAVKQKVNFIMSVCADQVLQIAAEISEELSLPCYLDAATAQSVSQKSYMKQIFIENGIPTTRYVVMNEYNEDKLRYLRFPLVVKPVDSYSSKGVRKVYDYFQAKEAFYKACEESRSGSIIFEEFFEGEEISVDVYVEDGKAHVLCETNLYKTGEDRKFVINRSFFPAILEDDIKEQIRSVAQKTADAFNLKNTPMLIQLLSDGKRINVLEFCARTGGGVKFMMIKKYCGFDVIKAVIDLTLGIKPHVSKLKIKEGYTLNEFIYCRNGYFKSLVGFDDLLSDGVISDYKLFKSEGHRFFDTIRGSGDRLAYFSVEGMDEEEIKAKHAIANKKIAALSEYNSDLIRHDLIVKYHLKDN